MCGLDYIRQNYFVPANLGQRIRFSDGKCSLEGVIIGAHGPHIRVRFDGNKRSNVLHPTWNVEYLTQGEGER